jgi:glycosyltransferase involved in cell wall biosynthesis
VARGRILLLSYHFPPAQTAGALRWQKLARHADERGFALDVLTLDPAALAIRDPSSLEELPASIRVFGVPQRPTAFDRAERAGFGLLRALARLRPRRAPVGIPSARPAAGKARKTSFAQADLHFDPTSLRSWLRAYQSLAVPMKERSWALRAAALGRRLSALAPGEHCAVVSCGPPHMAHEGGRRLARARGLPLVLDFRDAWSLAERLPEHFASPLWPRFAGRFEARAVAQARLVVMNTERARRAMQERYPEAAGRIIAVPNGCDEGIVAQAVAPGAPFRIAHAGSIYLDRSPVSLFQALARVVSELDLTPRQIEVAFMGTVTDINGRSLESEAAAAGVAGYLRRLPVGTRREAERFLGSAQVLVNFYQDTHMAIPSKVFEYMRHEAALLVLAEPGSATYELLRGTAATLAAPDDVAAIAAAIRKAYEAHRAGARPRAIATDPRFGRRLQAERLLDALEQICEKGIRR